MIEEFKNSLEESLDRHFPKLNFKDTTKPSPNNRSGALVLYTDAVILFRKLGEKIRDEAVADAYLKGWNDKQISFKRKIANWLDDGRPLGDLLKEELKK